MKRKCFSFTRCIGVTCAVMGLIILGIGRNAAAAQKSSATTAVTPAASQALVPQLIKLSGTLTDLAGKPISGPVDVTFSLYSQQSGGTPLWYESQTVNANAAGEYTTLLGAMTATGVPMDLFTSGQARWLGVAVRGLPEQSRILLVSVPYAMTSGDAEMLGGKPASDYLLASQSGTSSTTTTVVGTSSTSTTSGRTAKLATTASPQSITTGGTTNYLAAFSNNSGGLGNSIIYQDPTTNDIGIGTTVPLASTEVAGPPSTSAPATVLDLSRAYNAGLAYMSAASFLLSNPKVGTNNSRLDIALQNASRAYDLLPDTTVMSLVSNGNVGIGTTNPLAKTEVMGTPSTSTPSVVMDLSRRYNPGISYTSAASFLLSNPHVGTNNSRLDIALQNANRAYDLLPDTTVMSLVSNGNVGIGTTTPATKLDVNGDINASGNIYAANLSSDATTTYNTFVGALAGNPSSTGYDNVAVGYSALGSITTGGANTATGFEALELNTSGLENTAMGYRALQFNTGGYYNVGIGMSALVSNSTGSGNTGVGDNVMQENTTGYSNTAIGNNAMADSTNGSSNTAVGNSAMFSNCRSVAANCTGNNNTALGAAAGESSNSNYANVTGGSDTFIGASTGPAGTTQVSNATALGANAAVGESNALILGSINGINRATASTNVGIGTTIPSDFLDVNIGSPGPADTGITIEGASSTYGDLGLKIRNTGTGGVNWYLDSTSNPSGYGGGFLAVVPGPGAVPVLYVHSGPSVSIGTNLTTHPFTVCSGCGNAYADGWSTYSSRRFKTNIHTLRHGLAMVEQMRGVTYNSKFNGKAEVGVIAEEVAEVLPQIVGVNKDGKAEGVDYSRLTAVLIEAVKEQQKQIAEQQVRLRKENSEIQTLSHARNKENSEVVDLIREVKKLQVEAAENKTLESRLKRDEARNKATRTKLARMMRNEKKHSSTELARVQF